MYCHLRLHSEFSVVDGAVRLDELATAAAANGQAALAISDLNNLFGAVKFYRAMRGAGIKPIVGAEIMLDGLGPDAAAVSRVILLVQNHQGYLNLSELLARAWTKNVQKAQAVVKFAWLNELSEGLILLCGAQAGPVGQALVQGDAARAREMALQLGAAFPHRFYIEIQRAGRPDDERHVGLAVQLASRLQLPVVATHPVQFLEATGYEAHEARVCISEGEILGNARRVRRFTREQYFKSAEEMATLFADVPSALANTVEIAKRCNLTLTLGKPQLPHFPIPLVNGQQLSVEAYLRHVTGEGLAQRLVQLYPDAAAREVQRPVYQDRLDFELNTIVKMGFPGYFLIVGDFISWAKHNGCPVGPGRGSGAGSLVAYALRITDLDPLQYQLLFERFLNPERVSMPDFDIDFCQANRDRVIDYVKDKYGKEAVSQIVTFGTMAARAAIRDVGRVLDLSYTFCDGISKLIPNKPGTHVTIEQAIKMEPILAERHEKEEDVRTLISLAQQLEGLTRNVGMHAGGVLIAPGKLTDFCPLYQQPGSESAVSQFDKDDVEAIGLVKFDFLGLATLTILELAREMIAARHKGQEAFNYENLPLNDKSVYALFAKGDTEAVFQFESAGMRRMLKDARPSRLEDLIALNALFRPGPMDLIPSFVARKHGREEVQYPHPLVEAVLSETYGIMVYQEQVMQTAQLLGGYSLGGADMLRRAMGKKKAEEMAEHRQIFRDGAAKKDIPEAKADEIFDLMEKFAGYGFNKSHAAAYSLLAYHTAWIKVHFTAEFFCANMTVEMDDTDKLKALFEDGVRMGIRFEAPDVNRSQYRFEPVSDKVVSYGLGAVKGSGQQAVEAIVAARKEGGPFTSLFDFCARIDRSKVNRRCIEALVKAGAFDSLHLNRASLLESVDLGMDYALLQEANSQQTGLFDMGDEPSHGSSMHEPALIDATPWGVKERLSYEKTALGFYLSGHLFDESALEVGQFVRTRIGDLVDSREPQLLAGIVSELRLVNGQRGRIVILKIDDKTGSMEATLDEATYNASKSFVKEDELVIMMAKLQPDRFSGGYRLVINQIWDLPAARCRYGKYLHLEVNGRAPDVQRIVREFPPRREETDHGPIDRALGIRLSIKRDDQDGQVGAVRAQIQLGVAANFFPTDAALAAWMAQADAGKARIVYD
jgi:DNA polymerase-3 subunit alpha